jgi:FkbM family methyltransferase
MALESQLEALLAEDPRSAALRERHHFDQAAGPFHNRIVLFGAGGLGRKALRGLRSVGLQPLAFSDNNPHLWNKYVDEIQVLPPSDAAARFRDSAIFVVTIWPALGGPVFRQIQNQLESLGCGKVVSWCSLFWKYAELFLPEYPVDLPTRFLASAKDIRNAFQLFGVEASRREFVAQLRWRMRLEFDDAPPPHGQDYFPRDLFALGPNEVFVDCGAYDGDTIARFLAFTEGRFDKIIALEPDPALFAKLAAYVNCLPTQSAARIRALPLAAGVRREKVRFAAMGTTSSAIAAEGGQEVDCAPLDEILGGCGPTYIKMDIEGAEPEALMGGRSVLQSSRPIMAVCLYHQPDHFWRIPQLMNSLCPRSQLFLRPTTEGLWHLMCYSVPVERVAQVD